MTLWDQTTEEPEKAAGLEGGANVALFCHDLVCPSFALNLGQDESNLILHFNPRFDFHGDIGTIVCNSKTDGEWGAELREAEFPFQQGEETKVGKKSPSLLRSNQGNKV